MDTPIHCARCGATAWRPPTSELDQDTTERIGTIAPLSLRPGEALCRRCWVLEFDEIDTHHLEAIAGDWWRWDGEAETLDEEERELLFG